MPLPSSVKNYLSNLLILIDMTAVPAGCYFIIELLNTGWCTLRRALWLASPFLFAVLCYAVTGTAWIVDATFIFVWCYAVGFIIYMVYAVRRYNRLLAENYSNVERVHVRWLSGVAAMLAICLAVWTISSYYSSWVSDSLYQLTLLTMWVVALYYADRQQAPEIAPLPNVPKAHADSVLGDVLEQKLQRLMTEERLWVNPHLTLSDLAMQVGTNRTYLSNYLNNTLSTTFYDYVNDYRLQAALRHLHDAIRPLQWPRLPSSAGSIRSRPSAASLCEPRGAHSTNIALKSSVANPPNRGFDWLKGSF